MLSFLTGKQTPTTIPAEELLDLSYEQILTHPIFKKGWYEVFLGDNRTRCTKWSTSVEERTTHSDIKDNYQYVNGVWTQDPYRGTFVHHVTLRPGFARATYERHGKLLMLMCVDQIPDHLPVRVVFYPKWNLPNKKDNRHITGWRDGDLFNPIFN